MSYAQRPLGLIFLFLMLIMGIQAGLKKPICIDSNVVYKIDRISLQKIDSVYACRQNQKVSFSKFFYENLDSLDARLNKIELALSGLVDSPIQVQIDEQNPETLQIGLNSIRIGHNQLSSEKFEKAILNLILKNQLNTQDSIFIETLADYFSGTEQYQNLISEAFNKSIKNMDFYEKRKIRKNILKHIYLSRQKNTFSAEISLIEKLKQVSNDQALSFEFDKYLQILGYLPTSEIEKLKLDVIIEFKNLSDMEPDLADLSRQNPNLRFALQTVNGLFILPSYLKVPKKSESKLFARHRIIFENAGSKSIDISQYLQNSESLIQIKGFLKPDAFGLKILFQSGVKAFLAKNKQLDFVQIHLPSYKLKSKALGHVADYFKFVSNKKLVQEEHKALGWSQTKWSTDLNAFMPVANYDVIQYFRIN